MQTEELTEKKSVLVADDETAILRGLEKGLSKVGYEVVTANDGLDAREKMASRSFDIVLSDLKMPGMNGLDLLKYARSENLKTIFIMLTGYPSDANAIEAMHLGAYDYIAKPFTLGQVREIISNAEKRAMRNETQAIKCKKLDVYYMPLFLRYVMGKGHFIGPVKKGSKTIFADTSEPGEVVYDYVSTILPLKKYLIPNEEKLFGYDLAKQEVAEDGEKEGNDRIFFGVHPYDMQAVLKLDKAFGGDMPEEKYLSKRRKSVFIGTNCKHDEKFFYQDMNSYNTSTGFDIFMTKCFNYFILEVFTEKGLEMLEGFNLFETPTHTEIRSAYHVKKRLTNVPGKIGCHGTKLSDLMDVSSNSPMWEEVASKCLSCGVCSLVCPTCFCFDVTDKLDISLKKGARYRKWDSCLCEDFTLVAGGEVFREKRQNRIKHRFAHKFSFFEKRNGEQMCVGCGRCSRECPAGIDPVKLIEALSKENAAGLMEKVFTYKKTG